MGSRQLVFLFDLSACKDAIFKSREELNKILLSVRLACLRLLTEFSTKASNLRWGFKFFDSYGSINQTMCKFSFSDVSLEDFETLENEICVQYERHLSYLEALAESSQDALNLMNDTINNSRAEKHTDAPVKILQQALTQVLYEFQWENVDMWSPSHKKVKDRSFEFRKNFLFLISNFKESDNTLFEYFGLNSLPTKSKFCSTIIPQVLQKHLSEKACIHWVWLNISIDQSFVGSASSKVLSLLSDALHSIQGSLIPLSLLSQSIYHVKYLNCSEKSSSGMEIPHISNSYHSFNNSLLPFSSLFRQSLIHPFYSNVNSSSNKCNLSFGYKNTVIPVQVIKILTKNTDACKEVRNHRKAKVQSSMKIKSSDSEITWSKFIIECATSRDVQCMAYDILLCLPDDAEPTTTSAENLKVLIKTMYSVKISLILTCVTECGLQMTGLLTPLTNEIALIEILDPLIRVIHKFHNKMTENFSVKNEDVSRENTLQDIQNFGMELKNHCNDGETSQSLNDNSSKSFQMESLETWYKPSSVCNVVSFMQSKLSESKIDSVPQFLQQALKDYSGITSTKEEEIHASDQSDPVFQNVEMNEMLTDLNEEALLLTTKEIYNSALEPSGNTGACAKNIMKRVSNFYKKHSSSSFEENALNFMKNNFFLNARRISEKYAEQQEATDQKIKECQIQIFLFLETEVLTLPPDKSNCVNSVTALLRIMSFDDNDRSKLKSFCEVLRTSYSHNLHEVLVEIGEELGVFDFGEIESDDSPADTLSSELNNESDIFSSIISPDISEKSSSSACSQLGNRKLVRHRSDISSTRSRQILLPRTTPKKKKAKSSAQRKANKCSPRLATRNSQAQSKTDEGKPRNVRRNLFPKEKSFCSPKKSKCSQLATPKKIHSLRRKVVLETPSSKQNHSAFQRKKSRRKQSSGDSPKEIAESPKIPKMAEGEAKREFLKKLRRTSETSLKPLTQSPVVEESANFNYKQYTPESKRRLSLKLFSKLLSSPTLRMGVKKCTKRLFDQVSPQKDSDSNKKHKPCDESNL